VDAITERVDCRHRQLHIARTVLAILQRFHIVRVKGAIRRSNSSPFRWCIRMTGQVSNNVEPRFSVRSSSAAVAGLAQNRTRNPPLMLRPSSGAHASTVHRPSGARVGRISGSHRVCRTPVRFSPFTNSRLRPNCRSASRPTNEGPEAVRADNCIGPQGRSIPASHTDTVVCLFDRHRFASALERNRSLAASRFEFGRKQIASMHHDVGEFIMSAERAT